MVVGVVLALLAAACAGTAAYSGDSAMNLGLLSHLKSRGINPETLATPPDQW